MNKEKEEKKKKKKKEKENIFRAKSKQCTCAATAINIINANDNEYIIEVFQFLFRCAIKFFNANFFNTGVAQNKNIWPIIYSTNPCTFEANNTRPTSIPRSNPTNNKKNKRKSKLNNASGNK